MTPVPRRLASRRRVAQVALVAVVALPVALAAGPGCERRKPPPGTAAVDRHPTLDAAAASAARVDLAPALEAVPFADGATMPTVRFTWGTRCRVPARQEVTKRGRSAILTFAVVVEPRGDELAVRLDRMTIESIEGRDASDPAVAAQIAPVRALLTAVPTFIVSAEGDYLRSEGLEATVDAVLAAMPPDDRIARMMRSPETLALVDKATGDHWNTWVGAWIDWDLPPGRPDVREDRVEAAPGVKVPVTITNETLGRVKDAPALVLLRSRQLIGSAEATRALESMTRSLGERAGAPPRPAGAIGDLRRETTVTVALDAATGRPHRARSEMTIAAGDRREVEIRDTAFDWAAATGCAPPAR